VAVPGDPNFFWKRAVLKTITEGALQFAGKLLLGNAPGLAVATFVISRAGVFLTAQRIWEQAALNQFLDTVPAAELGLDPAEVARVKSSIFEGRIAWMNVIEAQKARLTWGTYGAGKLASEKASAAARFNRWSGSWDETIGYAGYGFVGIRQGARFEIRSLLAGASRFSGMPALTWDFSDSSFVYRMRVLCLAATLGAYFLPVPSPVKLAFEDLMDSFYIPQLKTEGALWAFDQAQGDLEGAAGLRRQAFFAR
jgi:hypothetical protein